MCLVAQPCPTLCDPMDCSLPGSSVHGVFEARILVWVAISSSGGSFRPRGWTWVSCVSCIPGGFFACWATGEAQMLSLRPWQIVKISLSFLLSLLLHFFSSQLPVSKWQMPFYFLAEQIPVLPWVEILLCPPTLKLFPLSSSFLSGDPVWGSSGQAPPIWDPSIFGDFLKKPVFVSMT